MWSSDWGHCDRCGREGTSTDDLRATGAHCYSCRRAASRSEQLTPAQIVVLRELTKGEHRYNGRMSRTVKKLRSLGLITAEYDVILSGLRSGRGTECWTARLTDAGNEWLEENDLLNYTTDAVGVIEDD